MFRLRLRESPLDAACISHLNCSICCRSGDNGEARRLLTPGVLLDQVEPAPVVRFDPEDVDEAVDLIRDQDVPVDQGEEPGDLPAGADALDLADERALICEIRCL